MKIKKEPKEIFDEYANGRQFNQGIGLYDTVKKNEDFYIGDQWKGVKADKLTKPVFNILKRVVTYYVAMIVSDDVGVHMEPFNETKQNKAMLDIISKAVMETIERAKVNQKCRNAIRNCAVDGDMCMYVSFNPDIETNQMAKGDIEVEIVENTNVIFGNPYTTEVDTQPYILIVQRLYTDQVKDMAKENGVRKDERDKIVPDSADETTSDITDSGKLTTVITKFWKEKVEYTVGVDPITKQEIKRSTTSVHRIKVCRDVVLSKEVDLGYVHYPIAYMSWEKIKNSYHGRSPVTGLIPNQIFVNKIFAMCMVYMTNMGFPKIFYDQTKLGSISNDVTKAIALPNMDMAGKMIDAIKAPDFSNQIIQLIDSTVNYTKDFMGASDAALGEIANPNNTSAIVAVQQASSVPLEIQQLDYYQFYEDIVRSIVDIMTCSYGIREVKISETDAKDLGLIAGVEYIDPLTGTTVQPVNGMIPPNAQPQVVYQTTTVMNFADLRNMNYDINVEIGQSSYWSEATQVQTLDNMFQNGILTDPVMYLENIPDKYVPNKRQMIDQLKKQQEQAQAVANQQAMQQLTTPQPVTATGQTMVPNNTYNEAEQNATETDGRVAGDEETQKVLAASKQLYGGNRNNQGGTL